MTFDEFCEDLFPNGWENFDDNLQLYDLRRAYNAGVNSVDAAPAAPVAQPVSEPSDADIEAMLPPAHVIGDAWPAVYGYDKDDMLEFARAVLALRPAAPRAPLTIPDLPRGWKVQSVEPSSYLTDEANARCRWMIQRVEAPYCTETGESSWHGATLHEAMLKAHEAMGLPFIIGQEGGAT